MTLHGPHRVPRAHRDSSVLERGREIRDDAQALRASVERAAVVVRREIGARLREHPYQTLGCAAAAGFVLGGGIATPLARLALVTGGRLAVALAVRRAADGLERTLGASGDSGAQDDLAASKAS